MRRLVFALAFALLASCAHGPGTPDDVAAYTVRVLSHDPPRLSVTATLPIDGQTLEMATTRPAGIAELDAQGWPGLVRNLRVIRDDGSPLPAAPVGAKGWRLEQPRSGRVTLAYEVDYSPLADRQWPAQREAAFADADHFTLIGRSLFITTPAARRHRVRFALERPWKAVTPWNEVSRGTYEAGDADALRDNMLALTRSAASVITSGGFRLRVVAAGPWNAARAEVHRVLESVVPQLVSIIGADEDSSYLVVLLPAKERGGESFRGSFAMTYDATPSARNRGDWGNTIAHEVFHSWNGWGMQGADYGSSQWFQEGFTEYAANVAMVAAGLIDDDAFRQKLAHHIGNYDRLATPLDAPGTRKGPPLYSGGALVAFVSDVMIREATRGERNIRDVYQALWKSTDQGRRPYAWPDIEAALSAAANLDWAGLHRRHIAGTERLPLLDVFRTAGIRIIRTDEASWRVERDPVASPEAAALWQNLTRRTAR